jgi:hypothetical protein
MLSKEGLEGVESSENWRTKTNQESPVATVI